MEATNIKISLLSVNSGQIPGLPKNPRFIKDDRFEKLKKSISDDPEMMELREAIVYPLGDKFVIIGGNMRYRACKELGFKEMPCKVLPVETPPEKLRAYAIKDNVAFGSDDWDSLANDWEEEELEAWGVETPGFEDSMEAEVVGAKVGNEDGAGIISIALNEDEQERWTEVKSTLEYKDDKTTLFRLVSLFEQNKDLQND